MSPKDHFLAVLSLPTAERASYLAGLADEVRPQVKELLAAHLASDYWPPRRSPPPTTLASCPAWSSLGALARQPARPEPVHRLFRPSPQSGQGTPGLPTLLEALEDGLGVHARLDELEGNPPHQGFGLPGDPNLAHAAFAELLI